MFFKGIGILEKSSCLLLRVHKHEHDTQTKVQQKPQIWVTTCRRESSSSNPIKNYFDTWTIFCRITACSFEYLNSIQFVRCCCCYNCRSSHTHVSASKHSKTDSGARSANEPSWCEWMRARARAWESESEMEIGLLPCPRCPSSWEESAVVWREGWLQIGWVYDTYLATLWKSQR